MTLMSGENKPLTRGDVHVDGEGDKSYGVKSQRKAINVGIWESDLGESPVTPITLTQEQDNQPLRRLASC